MSKEFNPLVSHREKLRKLGPQERVDFYYEMLTSDLAQKVDEAEEARKEVDDSDVRKIVDECASLENQRFLLKKLKERKSRGHDTQKHKEKIDLGMAGLFRIDTVHNRSMIKRSANHEKEKYLVRGLIAHYRHKSTEPTTRDIHKTIHGSPVNWDLETTQDIAGLMILDGNEEEALQILSNKIQLTETLMKKNEEVGKAESDEYLENSSSLGVLYYRKSKITQNLDDLLRGLKYINIADRKYPNWHRTATVAWYLLYGSLSFKDQKIKDRVNGTTLSLISLSKCFLKDPKSTLKAVKQAVTGG